MPSYSLLNENDIKNILNGMVEAVLIINDKGIIQSCNKTAETIFKYKAEELLGQNVSILMPEPDGSHHDAYINRFINTDVPHIIGIGQNVTARRKNGEQFPMRLNVNQFPASPQGERWFIGSCQDITLQKQREDNMHRNLKMESLGKITAGISHDFNNLLAVIKGYSELLSNHLDYDAKADKYINEIKKAADNGACLTEKLSSFSRNTPVNRDFIDINDVLLDNRQVLEKSVTSEIEITMDLDNDLWRVYLDKNLLSNVILNLTINAKHAMPEGGALTFSTSNILINSINSKLLDIPKGRYIELSVADTGIGMSENIKSQIFEPFFSTKGDNGTGLGLSQVYSFVTDAGGTITVFSKPGEGSSFSIYLPKIENSQHTYSVSQHSTVGYIEKPALTGKVLVVDDDLGVLHCIEKILSENGYSTVCVESGREALGALETENISMVVSDIIMPKMDGYELSNLIKQLYPGIKILLISGMPEHRGKSVTDDDLYANMLKKPFDGNSLLQRISELNKH